MRKENKRSLTLKTHTLRQLTAAELVIVAGGDLSGWGEENKTNTDPTKTSGGAACSWGAGLDDASCAD